MNIDCQKANQHFCTLVPFRFRQRLQCLVDPWKRLCHRAGRPRTSTQDLDMIIPRGLSHTSFLDIHITTQTTAFPSANGMPPLEIIPLEFSPKHDGKAIACITGNENNLNIDGSTIETNLVEVRQFVIPLSINVCTMYLPTHYK